MAVPQPMQRNDDVATTTAPPALDVRDEAAAGGDGNARVTRLSLLPDLERLVVLDVLPVGQTADVAPCVVLGAKEQGVVLLADPVARHAGLVDLVPAAVAWEYVKVVRRGVFCRVVGCVSADSCRLRWGGRGGEERGKATARSGARGGSKFLNRPPPPPRQQKLAKTTTKAPAHGPVVERDADRFGARGAADAGGQAPDEDLADGSGCFVCLFFRGEKGQVFVCAEWTCRVVRFASSHARG